MYDICSYNAYIYRIHKCQMRNPDPACWPLVMTRATVATVPATVSAMYVVMFCEAKQRSRDRTGGSVAIPEEKKCKEPELWEFTGFIVIQWDFKLT